MNASPNHPPSDNQAAPGTRFPGLAWVWVAIATALIGGFGLGAGLLLVPPLGGPLGPWWRATAQAHGHAQLFGWGGLMVLAVGLHFFPRLWGAPLVGSAWAPRALAMLAGGLGLRVIGQPLATLLSPPADALLIWLGLGLGGLLEVAGAGLAVGLLVATARAGPSSRDRPAVRQGLPLVLTGLGALPLALALNAVTGLLAATVPTPILAPALGLAVAEIGLIGFLAPICLAVSARFFPLYLGLRPAPALGLRLALAGLLAGLAARLAAGLAAAAGPLGDGLVGVGLLIGLWSVGQPAVPVGNAAGYAWLPMALFQRAPPPPGRARTPTATRLATLLLRSAYGWLLVAALLALAASLSPLTGWSAAPDLERHALGVGYVSLLILGMGALLLPSFLGGRAPVGPVAVGLGLGNLAAAARVLAPLAIQLLPEATLAWWLRLQPSLAWWLLLLPALAGPLGAALPVCLALIVAHASRGRRGPPR